MSSDLLDQMKISGSADSNVEEQNVPWSQQVDEHTSSDIFVSPINEENSPDLNQSASTQFQYPPFNAKDREEYSSLSNSKSRRATSNSDYNKKYHKSGFSTAAKDEYYFNAWGSPNARKVIPDGNLSNFNKKTNRYDVGGYDSYNSDRYDKQDSNYGVEKKKTNLAESAPKKTTWASIASQPAKLMSRTSLTTSSHKKKGPGMPPPPMIPGKHNLDVNTWDLPNNNPPPVPPPFDSGLTETNFSSGTAIDGDIQSSSEKNSQNKSYEVLRDDNNKQNYGGNRNRNSPSVHQRKHWPMQSTTYHGKQFGGVISSDSTLLNDGTDSGSRQNRYGYRKKNFPSLRQEDNAFFGYRDGTNTTDADNSTERILETPQAILEELRDKNNYNPTEINLKKAELARFFVIKSYSEDDIHRSIKYEIWCSTDHGNKRLDDAFRERQKEGGHILLFFSVNGSGHFCGMAEMMTAVDYNSTSTVWAQDKWKGKFKVKWIYVKDVPNNKLRHITLENNENKPVTNSRDTQEVPNAKGIEVLHILHSYKHSTSIFDDFYHYEKKQEEEVSKKPSLNFDGPPPSVGRYSNYRHNSDHESCSGNGQKYFNNGSTGYERSSNNRGNYNSQNDYRRYDSYKVGDSSSADRADLKEETDRENNEYGAGNNRYIIKSDYNRRTGDERGSLKYDYHERDFSDSNYIKTEPRAIRSSQKEKQQHPKDNECLNSVDRVRNSDY